MVLLPSHRTRGKRSREPRNFQIETEKTETLGRSSGSTMDATYDMRGSRHVASAETMDTIITLGDSRIIKGGWAAAHDLTRLHENNVDLLINCTNSM